MPVVSHHAGIVGRPPYWDYPKVDQTGRKEPIIKYANERLMEWWLFNQSTVAHEPMMSNNNEFFDGGNQDVAFGWNKFGGGVNASNVPAPLGAPCNGMCVNASNTAGVEMLEEGCRFKQGVFYNATFFVKALSGVGRISIGYKTLAGAFTELEGQDYAASNVSEWNLVGGGIRDRPFAFRIEPGTTLDKIAFRVKGTSTGSQDQVCIADVCVMEGRAPGPSIHKNPGNRPEVECHPDVTIDGMERVPAAFPDKPGTILTPIETELGVFNTDRFKAGQITGLHGVMPVPEDLKHSTWGLTVDVNVIPPTSIFEPPPLSRYQFDYVVIGPSESPSPASVTGTINEIIAAPVGHSLRRLLFFIPYSDLAGNEKGKVSFAFYRRADLESGTFDDTNAYVVSFMAFFGPEVSDGLILA